jgi:hypothetical protein
MLSFVSPVSTRVVGALLVESLFVEARCVGVLACEE